MYKDYNMNQITIPLNIEVMIPEDDIAVAVNDLVESIPAAAFEGFDHHFGASSHHPRMMMKIILCGYAQSVYSGRKIAALLTDSLRVMWLSQNRCPSYRTINRFRIHPHMSALIEEAFIQFRGQLQANDMIDADAIFIDGTKLEANANKYTFVFRKSVEKHQEALRAQSKLMYDTMYEEMIIPALIEESDEAITAGHLNTMHQALETVETDLTDTIDATEAVEDRKGIRARRSVIRKTKKRCADLREREMKYTGQLATLGDRNSYSKTDPDATFMRMKEDHIRNGQLKAGYNLQVASNNQFVLGFALYPNPTDTRTLGPFLNTMLEQFQHLPEKIVADAGYGSEANYEMIEDDYERTALIPYNTYYKEQKKAYKTDEMHPANWSYDVENDRYICPDGREIRFERYANRTNTYGETRQLKIYASDDCSGCARYDQCIKSDRQINKRIQKNMNLEYFKAQARRTLSMKENRKIYQQRKIDIETVFGNLKANLAFKRFSVRGARKVKIETGLALLALNLRKFRKIQADRLQKYGKSGDSSELIDESPLFLVFKGLYVPAPFFL
ncbi:IS1182 family transposase [Lacicoccus alkaliphilus]|uniref:Transposase, IS4 family n=1 Tax=Lacicoccus alkaliphilus DSM 16010 TaxID=1123231 RepID=A0A1M7AZV8_9BACL|nr:IS1182 family transposase [Salinicoccus alkaliphilus]SHL48263.1 transposase, IS4 family [Salinicoccus alkaliphilus DSM 16010]